MRSAARHGGADGHVSGPEEEVEMGLLAGTEHASESSGEEEEFNDLDDSIVHSSNGKMKAPLTREDKKAMALLIVLCTWLVSCCYWPLFPLFSSSFR
jgi:hypothetical protein